jgi:hypothetical protein
MALPPEAPVEPTEREIDALLAHRCFHLAMEAGEPPRFDSALALQRWWTDGGLRWLDSYVWRPDPDAPARERFVVLPPEPRRTLALDGHTKHPLAPLLCPLADHACGLETAGWLQRAEAAFIANPDGPWRRLDEDEPSFPTPTAACEHEAAGAPAPMRYARFRECLQQYRQQRTALPVGQFRAPREGWLVLHGRRGHYDFCDELRAYDLATGSAYIAQSCSNLVLLEGGSVDGAQTNARRQLRTTVGVLSMDNVREAALMVFLARSANEGPYDAQAFALPARLTPQWSYDPQQLGTTWYGSVSTSTEETIVSWSWIEGGRVRDSGQLRWGTDRGSEHHASALLRVAEAGLVPGCTHAPLPRSILTGAEGSVLERALLEMPPAPRCAVAAGPVIPGP